MDVPTTGKKYLFTCECWLGKDKEDGKTARIFTVGDDHTITYKPSEYHRSNPFCCFVVFFFIHIR